MKTPKHKVSRAPATWLGCGKVGVNKYFLGLKSSGTFDLIQTTTYGIRQCTPKPLLQCARWDIPTYS